MASAESRDVEPGAKFEFFGSDLSERCLEKAQSGLYTQFEIQRGLPIRHAGQALREPGRHLGDLAAHSPDGALEADQPAGRPVDPWAGST
jgi:hypothetical protein